MKKILILAAVLVVSAVAQDCLRCKAGSCLKGVCQQCEDGFMLSSQGWCGIFTPIEGCRVYDQLFTNRCVECTSDRTLIDSRCFLKPENCDVADRFRECLSCRSGFSLVGGKCYTQSIAACPQGSLPVSGYCQPLRAQNCLNTTGDDKICTSCSSGYSLINGRCLRVTASFACSGGSCTCLNGFIFNQTCYQIQIDRCTIRRDGVYCSACERGFVAIDGICLEPVKQDDINCNVKAPQSDYCTGCNQDYFLNIDAFCCRDFNLTVCPTASGFFFLENGKCLYRDRRCDAVDFRNNSYACLRCQQGFSLVNGRCERNICIRFSADNVCQQVFIGYIIIGINQYAKLPANCLSVQNNNRCVQCSDFTKNTSISQRQPNDFVCAYFDPNCIEYNTNGSCIQCLNQTQGDGFILRDRFCLRKAQNCLTQDPNDQSRCVQCVTGYHIDSADRRCYIDQPGCELYSTGSDCRQCAAPGFLLFNRMCFAVNAQCLDLDSNNNCRRCTQGLLPFRNTCVFYHPFCLEYGPDRVCSRAANGWALGSGMTNEQRQYYRNFVMRGQAIKNRNDVPSLNGIVSAIMPGSYSAGAIITAFPYANLLHTRISSVNIFGQIVSCNDGFTLVNQSCIRNVVVNCQLYSADEICLRCRPQFTLLANFTCAQGLQCASPQDTLTNGRCLRCAAGYVLIGVQCYMVDSRENINIRLQNTIYTRIVIENNITIAWPRSANCRTQTSALACSECLPSYRNVQGQCVIAVDRCANYGEASWGLCQACENGFTFWMGQCQRLSCTQVAGNLCQVCPAQAYYYLGLCLANAQTNCRIVENGVCVLCNSGFYLNVQNQCQQEVQGCLVTSKDTGRCQQCRAGQALYRERCVPEVRFCLDYNSNNQCIRCQSNTVNRTQLMTDGSCAVLEGQCARLDEQTRVCAQCNAGYTPIRQDGRILCVFQRSNCITYDIRGRCTACGPRFVLQNGQCRAYLQYCLVYSNDQLTCLTCANGTQLDNGCCRIPDPFCISYSQCVCSTCLTGYFLNSSGLCQPNPTGCDVWDRSNSQCLRCSNLYYWLNGLCVFRDIVINGCQDGFNLTLTQANGYQCLKCIQGFELNTTDNLCYGYNCLVRRPDYRSCVSCPIYYRILQGSTSNQFLNYCIPYFCDEYIPGSNQCVRNSSTYYGGHVIISITRTITITYCSNVDPNTGRCLVCSNYRSPNTNTLYGLCFPNNCLNPQQFDCLQCAFGYTLDSRFPGACVATFCSQYRPDGSCQVCTPPYTANANGLCENKGCCQIYDTTLNACRTPKKYFDIQNGICTVQNCAQLDTSKIATCLRCQLGFTLFPDGTCRASNCQQDSINGDSCIICNSGFRVEFSNITRSICLPRYCANITEDLSGCLRCLQGFTLDSNRMCRADFCLSFLPSLVCERCAESYTLDQNQRCVADCAVGSVSQCQCCKFGFTLNTTTRLCQPITSFCTRPNSNTGLCDACAANYVLVSGQCVAPVPNCRTPSTFGCLSCNVGYELVDNCRCVIRNCRQFNANGSCNVCHPRFQVTAQGLCKPRDCQFFSEQTWACNGCFSRFQFQNGMCVTTDCAVWQDFENTTCRTCRSITFVSTNNFAVTVTTTFDLVFGACYIRFCRNPREIYCKQCIPGFRLTMNGLCQCINYNTSTNACVCPAGYLYNNQSGGCDLNLDVCLARNANGSCTQCPFQYQNPALNGGNCVPLYCSQWRLGDQREIICTTCYVNFQLRDGFCESTLCSRYQNRTGFLFPQCVVCPAGFVPFSNFCIPANCEQGTYNLILGQCARCTALGYVLSPDRTRCVIANCETEQSGQCNRCKNGFYVFTGICLANNCSNFTDSSCLTCMEGFTLSNGLCYANNCAGYDVNNFCAQCAPGFLLTRNLTCIRMYCESDAKDRCLRCIRGYTFNSGLNRCVPSNCQNYNSDYSACTTCLQGFYPENATCIDIYCDIQQFNQEMRCLRCREGYQFNSQGLCYPTDPGFCPPGTFFNNSQGACVPIPSPDCRIFVNNRCLFCAEGFFLWDGLCYSIRFCSKFSYFFGCFECVAGYTLQNRTCKQVVIDENCLSIRNNQCVECRPKYQLLQGRCYLIPDNCQTVDTSSRCTKCLSGFTLNNGICQTVDPNCASFSDEGRCTSCRANFYINAQGLCQLLPVNCLNADATGRCLQCAAGFTLQNGRCFRQFQFCVRYSETTEQCVECNRNFTLNGSECRCASDSQLLLNQFCIRLPDNCIEINPNTFVCFRCAQNFTLTSDFRCARNIPVPENCAVYDPQTGVCRECLGDYILVNNSCRLCPSGQVKVGNSCFMIVPWCTQYLLTGQCSLCLPGYRLNAGRCELVEPPRFCQIYNASTGVCQQCVPGYTPINNGSLCLLNNCITADNAGAVCVRCSDGFSWTGSQCRWVTDFCLSYLNGRCQTCQPDNLLNQSRCVPNFCSVYDYINGFCTQCQPKYQLSFRRCFVIIQFCSIYSETGRCAQCLSGYSLSNDGTLCIGNQIPQCFAQTSGDVCNRCVHRYYEASQTCSPYLPYCVNIDPLGRCISCCFGSTLVNGNCVRDTTIKYCARQVGSTCQQCQTNYKYCQFCEACLPITPNCDKYATSGECLQCKQNFVLYNGVCVSPPVGVVTGTVSTCRAGYYSRDNNCYRNPNELKLFSVTKTAGVTITQGSAPTNIRGLAAGTSSEAYIVKIQDETLIIFGIVVNTRSGNVPAGASFILYYRSKQNDPIVCWNSCIPTRIEGNNYRRELVQPIIAVEVSVYLANHTLQNVAIDFNIL